MIQIRRLVWSLPFVMIAAAPARAADPPAIAALKEKGLTRSGRFFVIEAEKPVLEKSKMIRSVVADYTATARRQNDAEQTAREFSQLEERRRELQQKLDELNQQINEQGFQQGLSRPGASGQGSYLSQMIAQRDMVRMAVSEVVTAQQSVKPDPAMDKKTLEAESKKSLEATRAALADLRESVDAAIKRYNELSTDAAVKLALQTLENDKLGTFKLGPSTPFLTTVKTLENAERTVLAKKTSALSRKKGRTKR